MTNPTEARDAVERLLPAVTADERRMAAPIFIVSSGGSGSTLLRLILDSHEHIAIPQETCFMRLVKAHRWVPYWRFGNKWHGRLGLTKEELDDALRDFYGGLFERFARRQGKQRWGDKTPYHVWHMDEIAQVFDDAVFVGIVRHPGGTTASMVDRFGYRVSSAIKHWLGMNRALVYYGARMPSRFVLLRYEDLVLHPEETLKELLDWLDEPWSPSVLKHHDVQPRKGAPKVVDGRTVSDDPIDAGRMSKWMTSLTEEERAVLSRRTSGWAAFFGYDLREPLPVEPIAAPISQRHRLVTGDELRRRQKVFAERLDFDLPPRPAAEDLFRPPPRRPRPERNGHAPERDGKNEFLEDVKALLPRPVRVAAWKARRRLNARQRS